MSHAKKKNWIQSKVQNCREAWIEWSGKIRQVSIKSVGSLQSWMSPVWSVGDSASLASLTRVLWEDNFRHEIQWECLCLWNTRTEILSYFKRKENEGNSFSLTCKFTEHLGKECRKLSYFILSMLNNLL